MKIPATLALIVLVSASCSRHNESSGITAEDVAWATGWKFVKFELADVAPEPVYAVGFVLKDEENAIIDEGPWMGGSEVIAGDASIRVAYRISGEVVEVRFEVDGSGISGNIDHDFSRNHAFYSYAEQQNGLIPLISSSSVVHFDPARVYEDDSATLSLKLYHEPTGKPGGAGSLRRPL